MVSVYTIAKYVRKSHYFRYQFIMMAECIGCHELYDVINKDMKVLRGVSMRKKVDRSPTGWFSEVGNAEHVYVYHHPQHATCSSTFYHKYKAAPQFVSSL